MFESSYGSMLKKATESFKGQPLTELSITDSKALKMMLASAVEAAIASYSKGSVSLDREKDIKVVQFILNNVKVEDCRKKIDLYFSGTPADKLFKKEELSTAASEKIKELGDHRFRTGFMDGSKLEDYVVATFDSFYEHIIQPLVYEAKVKENIEDIKSALMQCLKNAKFQDPTNENPAVAASIEAKIKAITNEMNLNSTLADFAKAEHKKDSLEFLFQKNIKPILQKNVRFNEDYAEIPIYYAFKDFLSMHIEKYRQEKGNKQGKEYGLDEDVIESFKDSPTIPQNLKNISTGMSPLLKKHFLTACDEFERHKAEFGENRHVKIKTWEKEQKDQESSAKPAKIIIALHGWRDSVECWNNLGQAAIDKGYKVYAYDHRGYGFDDERRDIGHNNDYLAMDFRKFVQSVIAKNPGAEINLVGHSMGGSILLNNQKFIANQPAIKSVTCFSPAVTPSLPSFFSEFRNALFGREGHEEALARQQNDQPRFVKGGILQPANLLKMITTLPSLLSMMTQAYRSLTSLFTQPTQGAPWNIIYGKKDKAVPYSSFEMENKNDKVSVVEFSRGDHLLGTQGRHMTAAFDTFFKAIEPQQKRDGGNDELDTNTSPAL